MSVPTNGFLGLHFTLAKSASISNELLAQRVLVFLDTAFHNAEPHTDLKHQLQNFLKEARKHFDRPTAELRQNTPDIGLQQLADCVANIVRQQSLVKFGGETINVWQLAGVGRSELRVASLLAWLLAPNGSHGRGAEFLRRVIGAANLSFKAPLSTDGLERALVRTEQYPLIDPENRVDIEVIGSSFVMFIEVKVDAGEGENQLDRYLSAIEAKARSLGRPDFGMVFLCSRRPSITSDRLAPMTWKTLQKIILAEAISVSRDHLVLRHLLTNLASHVEF